MSTIILPIKKVYSDKIFAGLKTFEYRKSVPKAPVTKILVYESRGAGAIVGELEISGITFLPTDELWIRTNKTGGVTFEEFDKYFAGHKYGYAYQITSATLYNKPVPISAYGLKMPPQGFAYVRS